MFNRNFAYLAFIIAAAFLISSCNNSKHKFKDEATGNGYEITENKHEGNFYLEDIAVKFDASEEGVHGISILYDLKSEKGKGWFGNPFVGMMYDGYIITFTPKDMDGSMGSLDANTLSSFKKVYSRVRDENQEFFIPYFNLPFASGKRKVEFKIQGFPAMTDTNMTSGTREERLKPIRNSPDASYSVIIEFTQPEITKTSLKVLGFEINEKKVDAHTFDYRLFGPGYPDMFWEAELGKQTIYTSKVRTNKTNYDSAYATPMFSYSSKDSITITIWDHDDLSRPDFVGRYIGAINSISKEEQKPTSADFDSIKNFRLIRKF